MLKAKNNLPDNVKAKIKISLSKAHKQHSLLFQYFADPSKIHKNDLPYVKKKAIKYRINNGTLEYCSRTTCFASSHTQTHYETVDYESHLPSIQLYSHLKAY